MCGSQGVKPVWCGCHQWISGLAPPAIRFESGCKMQIVAGCESAFEGSIDDVSSHLSTQIIASAYSVYIARIVFADTWPHS